jgi:surfeit locus 1 family protein
MAKQIPYPLVPAWVLLQSQTPAQTTGFPRVVPPPDLDDGPHLSYAIQWFSFSLIALVFAGIMARQRRHPAVQ